jgi:NADH:ubiquinone oxidoreductase subunit 6 (subunit J)
MSNEASIDVSSNGTQRIMLFLDNYSRGITSLMLIQGAVILLLGIVFIVIAAVISSRERKSRRTQAAKSPLIAIRVILVVVLLLGAFFTTGLFYNTVFETLDNSSKKIENAGEAMEDGALARALEKTINIDISFYGQ